MLNDPGDADVDALVSRGFLGQWSRRSAAAPTKCSATSWVSGSWACPATSGSTRCSRSAKRFAVDGPSIWSARRRGCPPPDGRTEAPLSNRHGAAAPVNLGRSRRTCPTGGVRPSRTWRQRRARRGRWAGRSGWPSTARRQARRPGAGRPRCSTRARSRRSARWSAVRSRRRHRGRLAARSTAGRCMVGAEDFTTLAGTIGRGSNAKRYRIAELALRERVPLMMMLEGAGFRPDERGRGPHPDRPQHAGAVLGPRARGHRRARARRRVTARSSRRCRTSP